MSRSPCPAAGAAHGAKDINKYIHNIYIIIIICICISIYIYISNKTIHIKKIPLGRCSR